MWFITNLQNEQINNKKTKNIYLLIGILYIFNVSNEDRRWHKYIFYYIIFYTTHVYDFIKFNIYDSCLIYKNKI